MSAFDIDFKALKREVGSNMYMVVVLVCNTYFSGSRTVESDNFKERFGDNRKATK